MTGNPVIPQYAEEVVTCLFRRSLFLLFLLLDGGGASDDLWRVDWKRFVRWRLLFDVGYDPAFVVSQLVDNSRYERPFRYVLLHNTVLNFAIYVLLHNGQLRFLT